MFCSFNNGKLQEKPLKIHRYKCVKYVEAKSAKHFQRRYERESPGVCYILWWCRENGWIVVMLLLLTEDLQLEEKLLLLQETGIVCIHGKFNFLMFLVWWDILVVLELLHPGFWILVFLAAILIICTFGLALLV